MEYDLCPRRYYYGVIENIPPAEEPTPAEPPSAGRPQPGNVLPADILGTLVHKVLEKYAKRRMHNRFPEEEQTWRDLYENAVREIAGDRFDLAAEAETMLQDYLQSDLYRSFAPQQRFAEYGFRLPLLQDERYTYTVTGIIDAVVEREDGSLEIIDYKSGKPPQKTAGGDTVANGYAWQLALYKMALEYVLRIREKAVSGTGEEPASVSNEVMPARNCKEPSSESRHKPSPHVTKASLHYLRDRSEWTLPDKDYEKDFAVKTENCSLCPFAYMCKRDG